MLWKSCSMVIADIDAEKFLQVRRAHADRRVNAMERLTDDIINELFQLCLPHYHIKTGETVQQGRPYTRLETMVLETMVRVHSLSICPIRRWSHIWRATWWLATSAACLALVFSSQIRRYCASGISLNNMGWRRNRSSAR